MSRTIDADALIDKYGDYYAEEGTECGFIGTVKNLVDKMPTIEPERETGKWIPENRTIDAFWVCSVCGFPSEAHAANIIYKFCPNCGARMEGEGQS